MRKLLLIAFLLQSAFAFSQPYGNEWVNASQPHFKIKIVHEGVYRINYQVLNDALAAQGFSLGSIDPRNFQMFARTEEQHIYVEGESDGSFDQNDFIEFYAYGNDGQFDDDVYFESATQNANPYYSLINDTIWYFLTWNNSLNNARMTLETDVNFSGYTSSPYVLRDEIDELHDTYYYGENYVLTGTTSPLYTGGEGWYGYYFDAGWTDSFWNLSTSNNYDQGPDAEIEISMVGLSNDNKNLHIEGPSISFDTVMEKFNCYRFNFTSPTSVLGNNTTNFTFSINNTPANYAYRALVAYVKVRYPQTPNMGGGQTAKFIVPDNPNYPAQQKSRVQLSGYSQSNPWLYDLTNHKRITVSGNQFLIPDNGTLKECYLTHQALISTNTITEITPAGKGGTPYFTDFSALNTSTDYFVIGHPTMYNEVLQYAAYRNASGYDALGLDANEVYSQFGWGIEKHPLAFRKLAQWALDNLTAPKDIFLAGKAVNGVIARNDPALFAEIRVPSLGYPPSDNSITAYLGNNTYLEETGIPVGRLAATDPQQITEYLDKIMEYEALPVDLWMKKILHFSGGGTEADVTQIRSFMDSYKYIIEDTLFGGSVQTFQKTSSQPFQITQVDSIIELINAGVQMTNFFGHGSAVGFDVSIDHPSLFSNDNGKYPFMIANSCYAGDIHRPASEPTSISEEWVLEPQGGALGFLATIGPGNKFYLNNYCTEFYHSVSHYEYGNTIGWQMKRAIRENAQPLNYVTRLHNLEYTLHGDPALNITNRLLPDLMVDEQSIWFEPEEVTTEMSEFEMNIKITNLGAAFADSFIVRITRQLPTGQTDFTLDTLHPPVNYIDTFSVFIPIDLIDGLGINQLCVSLDDGQYIDELSEVNNDACVSVNILSPDIVPIWPYEFAVIPDQGPTLKCSTGQPFAPEKTYRIELDTTDLFNSPIMEFATITQSGGVVNWTPNLLQNMPDSTVYFWRASVDSATYGYYKWRETSFQYIIDKYGWGQAHYFQYKKDEYNNLIYDRPQRDWDFVQTVKQFKLNCVGSVTSLAVGEGTNFFIDNGREEYLGCTGNLVTYPQLLTAVMDGCTLKPWQTPGNVFGEGFNPGNGSHGQLEPCRTRPEKWYQWATDGSVADNMVNFLENVVPDSNYIGFTIWRPGPPYGNGYDLQLLPANVIQTLHDLGATAIDTLGNVPYAFFAKKGDPSTAIEVFGMSSNDIISLTADMVGCYNQGTIQTKYIGPTSRWNSFHVRSHPKENPTLDSIGVNIIGVRPNGIEEVVMSGINGSSTDILDLYNSIDASVYPRLKLNAFCADDSAASTPPQMDRWQVLFDGVPEAAINPHISFHFESDTINDGDLLKFHVAIENISDFDMDSLLVHYWIQDSQGNRTYLPYPRQAPLLAGELLLDTITTNPLDFLGGNVFWVEVNPRRPDQTFGYDQLEQYHFNNLANVQFAVTGDDVNPIMDVTFDGIHILDGDIVSAKPYVVIELDDESEYRLLNDTADFQVFLKEPDNENLKRVWFEGFTNMQFFPGETPDNKARIEWNAEFPSDGVYELWVQGQDKSDNVSGDQFFRISFEVINASTVTNVLNYPNPFSTSTQFVFTLTGSEQPEYFKIQIMTITGKVVKEVTMDELGTLNMGRNVTKYAWNGKDTYGDQLANGVYLYRVVAKLNGNYIDHRDSGADKWIESGFGKMMLIR